MGWARFDDGYMVHPKIMEAGPWAELVDRRGIEYCAKNETDGLVLRSALSLIGRDVPDVTQAVTALLRVGRWKKNPGGGWLVHDFLKYNPSKAQKEAQRAAGRERISRFRNGVTNAAVTRSTLRGGELLEDQTKGPSARAGAHAREATEPEEPAVPAPWIAAGITRDEWKRRSQDAESDEPK